MIFVSAKEILLEVHAPFNGEIVLEEFHAITAVLRSAERKLSTAAKAGDFGTSCKRWKMAFLSGKVPTPLREGGIWMTCTNMRWGVEM